MAAKALPDESLFFYNAYKIKFGSDPIGPKTIAKGYAGSLPNGMCSFKKFFEEIIITKHKKGWKKLVPEFGCTTNVQQVQQPGQLKQWGYHGAYDTQKLLGIDNPGHSAILVKLTDIVQTARKSNPTGWQDELRAIRDSSERIRAARQEDN
ncbi:hypothetical protein B9Z65_7142 [Elsinoe australis]|uniref:Uncharacterized protein n=1 Tax=Elsinoe australis TaxID=40998 RepID=A0A2P7Z5Z1_9PEZI|nr:hypothetical protein B9Z65_7142 [Elsinoe australis]